MNSWEKEHAEQEAAEKWLREWAFRDYEDEQASLAEFEANAEGIVPCHSVPLHTLDDYAAWKGMAPVQEERYR